MLAHLKIENIALIDKVEIDFNEGLNIMTGETGAGKSIVIESINAILGGRVSKDFIRSGKNKASVEAAFINKSSIVNEILTNLGVEIEEGGEIVISREISSNSKNICRINGKLSTVSMLKKIGESLIDIHGQYDNQSLFYLDNQLELVDIFCGKEVDDLKQEYSKILNEMKDYKDKLSKVSNKNIDQRIDLLQFQINEIEDAGLVEDEDKDLLKQKVILSNSQKIISSLSNAYDYLFSSEMGKSAFDNINKSLNEIYNISRIDDKYSQIHNKIEEIYYNLDDTINEIRHYRDNIEYNPSLLEEIESRIDFINRLKRKYGKNLEDILKYLEKIKLELEEITNFEELVKDLEKQIEKRSRALFDIAQKINELRCNYAKIIENKIMLELNDLEMKKAKLSIKIEFDTNFDENGDRIFKKSGLDNIEFLISTNSGEPLKSLSKIASGGEMSRIMLAIKSILAGVDNISTMIFDEIDTGISGLAAQRVGEKLVSVSRKHQVICVTHLAQIASMADTHFLIRKESNENTITLVENLSKDERICEIARILVGGNISKISLEHAGEMLLQSQEFKDNLNK